MTWLAENTLLIWVAGAIALTMAFVVYWQTRSPKSQIAIVVVILITAALLVAERQIETPREEVARTLYEIAAAVRENDMQSVLGYISPAAANFRDEVRTAMPLAEIDAANIIGTPRIEVDSSAVPPSASVRCRGFVHATLKRNGMKRGQAAALILTMVKQGDRWLITEYAADKDWRQAARGR
jgi:hypothetical protein